MTYCRVWTPWHDLHAAIHRMRSRGLDLLEVIWDMTVNECVAYFNSMEGDIVQRPTKEGD